MLSFSGFFSLHLCRGGFRLSKQGLPGLVQLACFLEEPRCCCSSLAMSLESCSKT